MNIQICNWAQALCTTHHPCFPQVDWRDYKGNRKEIQLHMLSQTQTLIRSVGLLVIIGWINTLRITVVNLDARL